MSPGPEERDPELLRRFAQQAAALDADDFVNRVQLKLTRLRRVRRGRRAVAWLGAVGLLVYLTPWVVRFSLILGGSFGTTVAAPWIWVLSLPLAYWVWRRTRILV